MAFIRSLLLVALASGLLLTSFAFNIRTDVSSQEVVQLQTPDFVQAGKRYAFTWAGGGPAQTYTVKSKRQDGWVLVEVAEENTSPIYLVPGQCRRADSTLRRRSRSRRCAHFSNGSAGSNQRSPGLARRRTRETG